MSESRSMNILGDYQGYHFRRSCGYCHTTKGSAIVGVHAHRLSVSDYQILMDRGFRRSGTFLYKPDLLHSCCPQYAIRLEAGAFRPSKEHRQTINRFNRYVLGEEYIKAFQRYKKAKHKALTGEHSSDFDLVEAIHMAESKYVPDELKHIHRDHELKVVLDNSQFTAAKFRLYKKYQIATHKDIENELRPESFKAFLCDDPFRLDKYNYTDNCSDPKLLGLFHQLYYLDGKLIAMAVLDFLPESISSVYFIWDQDMAKYSLGKLSACRETALAIERNAPYYYMGLYIHNCQKMRYKGGFFPSFLLDPELYVYFPLSKFVAEFEKSEYVSFSEHPKVRNLELGYDAHLEQCTTAFEANLPGIPPANEIESDQRMLPSVLIDRGRSCDSLASVLCQLAPDIRIEVKKRFIDLAAVLGPEVSQRTLIVDTDTLYLA
ncbi:arginine-tRNA-protein transferase [Lipomyces oligophaga]|uniref:arginine-tRNA-protein transferase n=1 Tax=Lipomyces oligophaga TaxID=45792 RepID=UPI0034CE17AA